MTNTTRQGVVQSGNDSYSTMDPGSRPAVSPAIDADASEIRAVQLMINDRPNTAQSVISKMTPKDRAVFAFYLRELGYMVETADQDARG